MDVVPFPKTNRGLLAARSSSIAFFTSSLCAWDLGARGSESSGGVSGKVLDSITCLCSELAVSFDPTCSKFDVNSARLSADCRPKRLREMSVEILYGFYSNSILGVNFGSL